MVLQLLKEEHMLLVQGTAFNWADKQHFRIVFLPDRDQLIEAIGGSADSCSGCVGSTRTGSLQ